jgi:hypothetical protein
MSTTMDEDYEDMMDDGRQLIVVAEEVAEHDDEELDEERKQLTETLLHQLTETNIVSLTPEQFAATEVDLLVTKATKIIGQAANFDDVLKISDWSARCRLYAKQAEDRTAEAAAIRIRLRAKRRLALMLATLDKAKGGWQYHTGHTGSATDPVYKPPTLTELGIKSKWAQDEIRKLAKMPEDEFQKHDDKLYDKTLNPQPKPKSKKLETMAEAGEGMQLPLVALIMDNARKDILNYKSGKIRKADLKNLLNTCQSLAAAINGVWDDVEEEGVVDVKSSSAGLNLEGM